jgi:hypothetical protein
MRAAVRDWADRHSAHAGHAPLSELYKILDGEGEWLLEPADESVVGADV